MKATVRKKTGKKPIRGNATNPKREPFAEPGIFEIVPIQDIDISPLNYRKYYNPEALEAFASELAIHGILQNVTLRKMPTGRFELVSGERRYRAAKIAEITHLPAIIRELTDEQVMEIQLAENIQRENPHPMHEALGIAQLTAKGKSMEETALRLGISKATCYSRLKLVQLIEDLQRVFLANRVTIVEAFEIAALSADDQEALLISHFDNWDSPEFRKPYNLNAVLSEYKRNLQKAPFNTEDAELIAEAGACTGCPFNSAAVSSLFPELELKATCSNRGCYTKKCTTHLQRIIVGGISEVEPVALLVQSYGSQKVRDAIQAIPEAQPFPILNWNDVRTPSAPTMPDKEDFMFSEDDKEDPVFDGEAFEDALQDYETRLADYNQEIANGDLRRGLYITDAEAKIVYFTEFDNYKQPTVTAKQVQEAIKTGEVTIELLQAEISRLNDREARSKELDREKVQVTVFEQFCQQNQDSDKVGKNTKADNVAVRFLIYNGLGWHSKHKMKELFGEQGDSDYFAAFSNMTDQQFCYMIRLAMAGVGECKAPGTMAGNVLYRLADKTGIDVATVENEQRAKSDVRQDRLNTRLDDLKERIAGLTPTDAEGETKEATP